MKKIIDSVYKQLVRLKLNKKYESDLQYFQENSDKIIIRRPMLEEDTPFTSYDGHYTFFTIWALEIIKKINPEIHIDVASTLNFVTAATLFSSIKFYDIRPPVIKLKNLTVHKGDITRLPIKDGVVKSLSCMHVIEHIGLGRYGDQLDLNGDQNAANELKRVLSKNGNLLITVPLGRRRIEFNAHRVYSYQEVIKLFSGLKLHKFDYISEELGVGFVKNNPVKKSTTEEYGCGCFWFKKED